MLEPRCPADITHHCPIHQCEPEAAATEFASLTAVMALMRALAGIASGYMVDAVGFASFFLLTFSLALPSYVLLPWVRRRLQASTAVAPAG